MTLLTMLPFAHKNRNASPATQLTQPEIMRQHPGARGTFGSLSTHPSNRRRAPLSLGRIGFLVPSTHQAQTSSAVT